MVAVGVISETKTTSVWRPSRSRVSCRLARAPASLAAPPGRGRCGEHGKTLAARVDRRQVAVSDGGHSGSSHFRRRGAASSSTDRIRSRIERIPTTRPPSTTGRWRKPPWIISTAACSVVSSGSIVSGWGVMKSPTTALSAWPPSHRAEHVALGEDAFEPVAGQHEHRSDAALIHLAGRLDERGGRLDAEQVAGHVLGDGGHRAPVYEVCSPVPRSAWVTGNAPSSRRNR